MQLAARIAGSITRRDGRSTGRNAEDRPGVQVTTLTGTPSSFREVASEATLNQLEFEETLEQVASRAVGAHGAERGRQRRPTAHLETVRAELNQVRELAQLLDGADGFRPEPVESIEGV